MISNKIGILGLMLAFGLHVKSQATKSDPTDTQGWFSASVEADLPKKWSVDVSFQTRYNNNISNNNGNYYSVGVKKRVYKPISAQVEYRLAKVLKGTYNRYSGGIDLDFNIKKIKLDLRLLYQNQIQDFDDPVKESDIDHFMRLRIRGRMPLYGKTAIVISAEPIYQVSPAFKIDNYRYQMGLRHAISKQLNAELFYFYRPDYAKSYLREYHTFGTAITYSFKTRKKG